jgi:hypothetical protein
LHLAWLRVVGSLAPEPRCGFCGYRASCGAAVHEQHQRQKIDRNSDLPSLKLDTGLSIWKA